jgi:hypothetical protein
MATEVVQRSGRQIIKVLEEIPFADSAAFAEVCVCVCVCVWPRARGDIG